MTLPSDPVEWAIKAFDDNRNENIDRLHGYLEGKQPIAFATQSFRETFGRLFESFAYNQMPAVVDAHNDRLQVTGLGSDDPGLSQRAQAQWDANKMDVREGESTGDALAYGDGFLIVEADPDDGSVHYWVNEPKLIRMHYSDDRPGHNDLAAKRWIGEDKHARLNLYFEDRIEKYISRNASPSGHVSGMNAWTKLELEGEDQSFTLPVTDTVPVFHLANGGRTGQYGASELKQIIPLQDAINYVLMSSMVATEFSAFAQKVIMGVRPEDDEEERMFQEFSVGVKRILTLQDENAKIGEFSASNLNMYMDVAYFWISGVSNLSRVPARYLRSNTAPESGESKRMDEAPFTSKIINRQNKFGYTYADAVRYGLRLEGMNIEPGAIRVNWQSAAPHSELDTWEIIREKRSSGMPFRAALREGGYDPDQIELILKEQDAERLQVQRFLDAGGLDPMPEVG